MKITFVSNYLNHHQLPFCLELHNKDNVEFKFIATEKISQERINLGYEDMNLTYEFVIRAYENEESEKMAIDVSNNSDLVIIGSAPDKFIKDRLKENKITFRYSERIFKKGTYRVIRPRVMANLLKNHTAYKNNELYMLCASAYTAKDFKLVGAYRNKCYKWGYFPKVYYYDIEDLISKKRKEKINILWCGRFIKWKRPQSVIKVAKYLKKKKYNFQIVMIGEGELKNSISELIEKNKLQEHIKIVGAVASDKVRKYMDEANIFLFTSNKQEGWGAVLNESMNSACAVIANKRIGSVPYLVKDGENGLTYVNNRQLLRKVELLLKNEMLREKIAKNAYLTISEEWNAKHATNNLIMLYNAIKNKQETKIMSGPCSKEN